MLSKIMSKVLVDEGILGGHREEVLFFVFTILRFIEGDMGKAVEAVDGGRRDGDTGNNVLGTVGDVEKGKVFNIVKDRPDELRGLRDDGLEDTGGNIKGTWVVPSIVRALEDLEDGSGGVCNILLIGIIKGRPGSDGNVGEGGGGDDGGLGGSEGHFTYTVSST